MDTSFFPFISTVFLLIGLIAERLALKPERLMRQIRNDKKRKKANEERLLRSGLAAERADCPSSSSQATLGFVFEYCPG